MNIGLFQSVRIQPCGGTIRALIFIPKTYPVTKYGSRHNDLHPDILWWNTNFESSAGCYIPTNFKYKVVNNYRTINFITKTIRHSWKKYRWTQLLISGKIPPESINLAYILPFGHNLVTLQGSLWTGTAHYNFVEILILRYNEREKCTHHVYNINIRSSKWAMFFFFRPL